MTRRSQRRAALLALAVLVAAGGSAAADVVEVELTIDTGVVDFTGEPVPALTVNGGIPGPTLEFTEGDVARIRVRNALDVPSSVHWHGLLVPAQEDGVPYVSYPGIAPGTVFTYEFPLRQAGTYWYHSHTGFQEQRGVYGAIVIHPRAPQGASADREHVVVLSDWTDDNPDRVMGLLRSGNEWYSIVRGTNQSLLGALRRGRLVDFLRREWESMPDNEISDVAYDRFLINGRSDAHLDARPGDTVRLRLIDAASSTYFYVQYACGPMTVVAADGQDVEPLELDRLLISIAETYDVLVKAPAEGACELRATAQDGSGHVAALVGDGRRVAAPAVPPPDYYVNTMNAGYLKAMLRTAWDVAGGVREIPAGEDPDELPPAASAKGGGEMHAGRMPAGEMAPGKEHGGMVMEAVPGRPPNPYAALRSPLDTTIAGPRPTRIVELNLTGDMDRYVWSMNGEVLRPSNTIRIRKGERVRFVMSNRTMMNHPMHLHGHFFRVLNGQGAHAPLKHTVNVAPMETTVIEFDANEEKDWFFHCHVLYHMHGGMERVVHYEGTEVDAATLAVRPKLYADSWYAFGGVSALSQMSAGELEVADTRNIVAAEFEVGYDEGEYGVTGAYGYYVNRYLTPFAGVNAYRETGVGDDVRGVFGVDWLLPLNARTTVWVGTDASFRWTAAKDLWLTRRFVAGGEVEYDTETQWEWIGRGEIILTPNVSVVGQYSSEYGAGAGVRVRLYSADF